ncbi:MAG: class I SAM-dependent methyltransferase [Opitutales bacterium]|nr:class I SAM-dependent methyltransferase [Opitutales bacterium]
MIRDSKVETGAAKLVWNDHEDKGYIQDQSHWRGVGRWKDDKKWQSIGQRSAARFDMMHRFLGVSWPMSTPQKNFLEWGPGGGANLFTFAGIAENYYGVDVSANNLTEAERMIAQEGKSGVFRPILLDREPSKVIEEVEMGIDYFLSTAVFQHFPSKVYGVEVLEVIRDISKPKALGFVQIRFDNGNEKYAPIDSVDEYVSRHITANSYQIDEFHRIVNDVGFEVLFIREIDIRTNYCTFYLRKR